jgi:hypothetical protein
MGEQPKSKVTLMTRNSHLKSAVDCEENFTVTIINVRDIVNCQSQPRNISTVARWSFHSTPSSESDQQRWHEENNVCGEAVRAAVGLPEWNN